MASLGPAAVFLVSIPIAYAASPDAAQALVACRWWCSGRCWVSGSTPGASLGDAWPAAAPTPQPPGSRAAERSGDRGRRRSRSTLRCLGLIAPLLPAIEERTGASEGAAGARPGRLRGPGRPAVAAARAGGGSARPQGTAGCGPADGGGGVGADRGLGPLDAADRGAADPGDRLGGELDLGAGAGLRHRAARASRPALGVALGATSVGSIAGPALGGVAADVISYEAPFLIACGGALAMAAAAARPAAR